MTPLLWNDKSTVDHVEEIVRNGGVILAEGDTILGLLVDISIKGHAALDRIKNRDKKPYLILVENQEKAFNFIEKDDAKSFQIEKIMNMCWPGPATLIFRAKQGGSPAVTSQNGTIAIRVPDHAGLLTLLSRCEGLFSTSANLSGMAVPTNLEDVDPSIMQSVAGVVLNDISAQPTLPSTIIDCTGEKIKIVREGAFPVEKLAEFF
jgi:L-threonylcarbamoyladenylate synthase